jgi:leader peptidase (prepilin peptidase)/N-methyltransferase
MSEWIWIIFFIAMGAAVGSFLNVCIWRMPRKGLSVNCPRRSHCPSCGTAIAWYDNLPLVSWWTLGGRCRACDLPISMRYFVIEVLTAMVFGVLAYKYLGGGDARWGELLAVAALSTVLIVASFIDIDLRILPDEITLGGMMVMPLIAVLVPELHTRPADPWVWSLMTAVDPHLQAVAARLPQGPDGSTMTIVLVSVAAVVGAATGLFGFQFYWRFAHPRHPNRLRDGALAAVLFAVVFAGLSLVILQPGLWLTPRSMGLVSSLLGMATGSGLVLGVGIVGKMVFRKEAMGFGDVKLMGLLGGYAGWMGVLAGFALACLLGSAVGIWRLVVYKNRYLWFGPFLSLGCLIVIVFPDALRDFLSWYLDLFR